MTRAIQHTISQRDDVQSVYGFGSFFRNEPYRDVDVIVVISVERDKILNLTNSIRAEFSSLGTVLGVVFDTKVFTRQEFAGHPIRDMSELHLIHSSNSPASAAAQQPPTAPS